MSQLDVVQSASDFGVDLFENIPRLSISIFGFTLVCVPELLSNGGQSRKSDSNLSHIAERSLPRLSILGLIVPAEVHRLGFTQ
jgi:hypothetical protein